MTPPVYIFFLTVLLTFVIQGLSMLYKGSFSLIFLLYFASGEYTSFSQDHCAKVWLGIEPRPNHNAVEDAVISISLFNAYRSVQWDPQRMHQMRMAMLAAPRIPGFSSRYPVIDNCW
jgi:hypothetical protein